MEIEGRLTTGFRWGRVIKRGAGLTAAVGCCCCCCCSTLGRSSLPGSALSGFASVGTGGSRISPEREASRALARRRCLQRYAVAPKSTKVLQPKKAARTVGATGTSMETFSESRTFTILSSPRASLQACWITQPCTLSMWRSGLPISPATRTWVGNPTLSFPTGTICA